AETDAAEPMKPRHAVTLVVIAAFILAVMLFRIPVGPAAFAAAVLLALLKIGDSEQGVSKLPWNVIILVSGISVLIGFLEKTGGLSLATDLIAHYAAPGSVNAVLAFVTGVVSLGSSSSGVVMPLFIPLAPEILSKMGGGDLTSAIVAIDAGSHMVDVSPLSTLGALCLAALPASVDRAQVFRRLLAWGISMAFVGAILAFIFLDLL
ncbi:MAG TPA: SLC13 family permease, partial [Deinococcales bacterium]|nr:SLC13 family permease [Deinococcales bacterium]